MNVLTHRVVNHSAANTRVTAKPLGGHRAVHVVVAKAATALVATKDHRPAVARRLHARAQTQPVQVVLIRQLRLVNASHTESVCSTFLFRLGQLTHYLLNTRSSVEENPCLL